MLKLYIGNKNYSSWSMRPWVLLKQAGIAFEEVKVRFDSFDSNSSFKQTIGSVNPVGKVPALLDDGFAVWDTLAIAEYLAEKFPDKKLWPQDAKARARARSICAEMHSGFGALRSACPMNIEADLADIGKLIWRDKASVRTDVARITAMWSELLGSDTNFAAVPRTAPFGGAKGSANLGSDPKNSFLFGEFSIADAYFAPVCMRLKTYALPVPQDITAYISRVCAAPGVKAWMDDALLENDFRDFEEPYRMAR